ncbi:unnamed protein product [Phytophthora fragariaefolia]|uniref:RNA-directed DNA polymerase n=1 Tax=Phytophthora fragariaefolia TaxID=1490495 RepID=A0A9W7CFC0_9STRA|nr:unnamed protein product [Phytophthora fragariaefolia]
MKSVGAVHSHLSEYDPDDLNVDVPVRAAVAAADSSGAGTVSVTRIRVSAISDLKRSDESPLEYLYRLNVVGLRAQLSNKDRSTEARREHVDHFIETLDGRDLASRLALLRIPDAATLEETLRSQERAKARQGKTVYGSTTPKTNVPAGAVPSANTRAVCAVRAAVKPSDSDSETSGLEREGDLRKVNLAADVDRFQRSQSDRDPRRTNFKPNAHWEGHQSGQPNGEEPRKPCSHCGSAKHSDLECWQRWTCEKCGKKGHPTDRCLFTCKACGEIHGAGECPLEEFYNLICQCDDGLEHLARGVAGILEVPRADKKFRQAKATGKINNEKATLLFDSGTEVSILDAAFARKVGIYLNNSQELECKGVGKSPCMAKGRTRVKLTLAGSLVYYFDVRVGPPTGGPDLILGKNFMVPAGVRLDLADGSLSLLDEITIQLAGGRPRYGEKVSQVKLDDHCNLEAGGTFEVRKGFILSIHRKHWVTRGERWVPSVVADLGQTRYLKITYISDQKLGLQADTRIGPADRPIVGDSASEDAEDAHEVRLDFEEAAPTLDTPPVAAQDDAGNEEVCYHEGGDLFAEDVERAMEVLPEVTATTDEVTIDGIQGNAQPPAAVGVVRDIDVGGAAPLAQRVRRVAPQFSENLSDLIKGLLSAKMITPSTSPWASPIVIIIKKNGVDIRLCIDFRLVNSLTRFMVYPMPMINDLLEDLDKVLSYCSLDMASGFWVLAMTERAWKISAFITPFGLFEWTPMPFGLKNALQIYQRLIDNALYGHLRIGADQDCSKTVNVYEAGEPEPNPMPSLLGRRSCIDDILVTATTWDSMCDKVERPLDACERWNLSISVVKGFWGQRKVGYLDHRVSAEGLEAHPKDPETLRDFHEIGHQEKSNSSGRGTGGVDSSPEQADRWTRTKWAISAALVQEHDGVYWPVTFTSRALKSNELNYGIVDKEVLDLMRMFEVNYTLLTTRSIVVLTRRSTLAWLVNSTGFQGRLGNWAALLSEWMLEVRKCSKGEDEFLGVIVPSITPRTEVDEALIAITPVKEPRQTIALPPPTVEDDESLLVASFDGAARTKRSSGAYSAIIWKLPVWATVAAASGYSPDLAVNEAEYHGLLLCFDLLSTMNGGRIVICGDSNLAIRQIRGEIARKAPGLQLLPKKAPDRHMGWLNHDFLHMKRE